MNQTTTTARAGLWCAFLCGLLALLVSAPGWAAVKHPYMLWTADEAAEMRQRLVDDPLARKQYERMEAMEARPLNFRSLLNLFKYSVMGDKAAGETEKRALLGFVGKLPPASIPGNPNSGNMTHRDDRTLEALRYDILYDLLSDTERKGVEDTIRAYVDWFQKNPGSYGSRGDFPRTGWLPNMQWPTYAGIHVLAAALGDEALIKQVFETPRGWKWYLDVYIADGRFYMEEFAKYPSNIGAMLLWCEGLERLGLSHYGYGYTGKGGATMGKYLQMLMWAGYPRVQRPGAMPDYPSVTMGDASPSQVLDGCNADGSGGSAWYGNPRMWGDVPKMLQPLWWEAGHRRFPDAGFDYFLAQMRKPGEDVYLPSLYFGLKPIDATKVRPPAAPSHVASERGFAMLRAEESPAYWESPKPAVALQFGVYYVHYVHDCFSIMQYVAHNRYIYNRMGAMGGGYAGGDPWRDHVRGQASGVVVDGLQAQPIDNGESGISNERLRKHFSPPAKFVAIRAKPIEVEERGKDGVVRKVVKAVYPGVDMERALVLTDEYLFDAFALSSETPRIYDWHVTSPASLQGADAWTVLDASPDKARGAKPYLGGIRVSNVGTADWSAVLQQAHLPGGVGVKVWMLGADGTLLVCGKPPAVKDAGVTLMATRQAARTTFAALHEPFAENKTRIQRFERLQETAQGLAVRVVGEGISDRILMRLGDDYETPLTLAGDGETFTFRDYALIRVKADAVEVSGQVDALKIRVNGTPKLIQNGEVVTATVKDGWLTWAR